MRARVIRRPLGRAITAALAIVVLSATFASADTLMGDADNITPDIEGTKHLGDVAPGEVVVVEVPFWLTCASASHVNRNQVVTLSPFAVGDSAISATETTIGPPPAEWPLDGDACAAANEPVRSNGTSTITITAPLAERDGYFYNVGYMREFAPASSTDGTAIGGTMFTFVSFTLNVVVNTPPTLDLPSGVTIEATTADGAYAQYTVGATDAEDDPDPTPVCSPAVGESVALGDTTVDCTVTDGGGKTATGSFTLTVVDTTPPAFVDIPSGVSATTASSLGTVVSYDTPAATDIVDPVPHVDCSPASGSQFALGTTLVSCTATDADGNVGTASFPVTVNFAAARWESPIAGDPAWLVGNHGRTIPVKLALLVGGDPWTSGSVDLVVTGCGSATELTSFAAAWQPDTARWMGHLNTSALPGPGCYTVTAQVDESGGPSFRLELRGAVELRAPGQAKRG